MKKVKNLQSNQIQNSSLPNSWHFLEFETDWNYMFLFSFFLFPNKLGFFFSVNKTYFLYVKHWKVKEVKHLFYYVCEAGAALFFTASINLQTEWKLCGSELRTDLHIVYKLGWNVSCESSADSLTRSSNEGGIKYKQLGVKMRGWSQLHRADGVMQPLTFVTALHCALNIYRRNWVTSTCRRDNLGKFKHVFLSTVPTPWRMFRQIFSCSRRNSIVLMPSSAFSRLPLFPRGPGIPQIRRLFFWTMPSLSRRLLGPTLFVWPLKEEFSTLRLPPERAAFFSSCFIDTGGSGSPRCVWQCF